MNTYNAQVMATPTLFETGNPTRLASTLSLALIRSALSYKPIAASVRMIIGPVGLFRLSEGLMTYQESARFGLAIGDLLSSELQASKPLDDGSIQ